MAKDDARAIRAMLQDRLSELLGVLLPGGRVDGGLYVVRNPTRDDKKPGSFVIWMHGNAKGGFKDYAGSDADKGDVIQLISYVHRRPKSDNKFALEWARDWLGLKTMDPKVRDAAKAAASAKAKQSEQLDKEDALRKRMRALEMFKQGKPLIGSIAERYFEAREIPLQLVTNREDEMRFLPSLEYWRGAEWEQDAKTQRRRKLAPGPSFPAIISAVKNAQGVLIAVHCVFLQADGAAKAPVENAKLMYGGVAGGVIRLTKGGHNQTIEEAALSGARDTLIISEGWETGLSVAIAVPEARVWAATSLSNIANAPVWLSCVKDFVIAADNPNENASPAGRVQAHEQLERAFETLSAHGIAGAIMTSHYGNDFNDLMQGVA